MVALSKTCRDAGMMLGQYNRQRRLQRCRDSRDAVLRPSSSEQLSRSKPGQRCTVVEAGTTDSTAPHAF